MRHTDFWWAAGRAHSRTYHAVRGEAAAWETLSALCGTRVMWEAYLRTRTDLDRVPEYGRSCRKCRALMGKGADDA